MLQSEMKEMCSSVKSRAEFHLFLLQYENIKNKRELWGS